MRHLLPVLLLCVAAGCALLDRGAARVLADADAHAVHGDYPAAMAAYDSYLSRYPGDGDAGRARASRALVAQLLAVRAERERLVAERERLVAERDRLATRENELAQQIAAREAELARQAAAREAELARQGAARENELARLKQELAARQAEIARLREDFEALKRADLQMERRRR